MITSNQNPKIQHIRSLLNRAKDRQGANQFIVEGVRLVEEACQAGRRPDLLFYSQDLSPRGLKIVQDYGLHGVEVEEVLPGLLHALTQAETSQGILAVFPLQALPIPPQLDFVLIVDNLRDPGNLGTILRTAAAAGVQALFLAPGCTDPFAPKVVRAGMGAHFHLPIADLTWQEIVDYCKIRQKPPLRLFLAEGHVEKSDCWACNLRQPLALIIGGEAEGASEAARKAADQPVCIPMPGKSESLNAAVAAGILTFEVVRQRSS